ncbi:uncharacterized protein LOC127853017 [Dreissena polymorpha]|uniref:uncharacterized protein LOC127853017 n=1 Tax=Dreissena polymorpha TaxID=45954 RepID=UPI00226554C4|nr:uncharacterized protein LOC127853017 [Dreissena polymorpha]
MVWISLFAVMAFLLVNDSSAVEVTMYDSCIEVNTSSPALFMDCGDGDVITDIQYEAGFGTCDARVCKGESASLLIDVMDCHWNRTCLLSPVYPAERIVRSGDSCYNRNLEFLNIKSYRCFHNATKILNISDGGILSRDSGIIRSHSEFPWNYGDREGERTHNLTLVVHVGKRLYVSALYDVDLGEDDFFNVTSKSTRDLSHLKSGVVQVVSDFNDTKVTFTFHVSSFTQSGKGFALCFKFSATEITENVCNEITIKGSLKLDVKASNTAPQVVDQTSGPETTPKTPGTGGNVEECDKKCQRRQKKRHPKPQGEGKGEKRKKKNDRKNKKGQATTT